MNNEFMHALRSLRYTSFDPATPHQGPAYCAGTSQKQRRCPQDAATSTPSWRHPRRVRVWGPGPYPELHPLPVVDDRRIIIEAWDGRAYPLSIHGLDTIRYVKAKIHEQRGPPPDDQVLTCEGLALDDDETLDAYGIYDYRTWYGSQIFLIPSSWTREARR